MNVYLVRHTHPSVEKSFCYGQTDLELNTTFRDEFVQLKELLPTQAGAIYSSPLKRCSLLAYDIQKTVTAPLFIDDRLKEMNFGQWENKRWNDINQTELDDWMNDFVRVKPPQGESFLDLHSRIVDFIKTIIYAPSAFETIFIITHAGVIRCFLNFILHFPLNKSFKLKIDYGSVTFLTISPQPELDTVVFFNKTKT